MEQNDKLNRDSILNIIKSHDLFGLGYFTEEELLKLQNALEMIEPGVTAEEILKNNMETFRADSKRGSIHFTIFKDVVYFLTTKDKDQQELGPSRIIRGFIVDSQGVLRRGMKVVLRDEKGNEIVSFREHNTGEHFPMEERED